MEAEESTLALQIRAAVTAKVEPFEVEIVEIERGQRLMVGVVGIKQVFGYRRFMADGTRNQHTPETFADAVVDQVQQHVGRAMAALANAKIEANEIADRIEFNSKQITVDGANYNYLVHDFAQICTKPTEDFAAIMAQRIASHKAAEAEKAEAAKKAEEARIAAAVEAERKAGEARAAAAVEAERMAEAKRVAEAAQKTVALDPEKPAGDVIPPQAVALAATPIQQSDMGQSLDGAAGKSVRAPTADEKRAVLVEAGDDVREYLNTLGLNDKEFGRMRAVLMGYEQFKAERAGFCITLTNG